MSLLYINDWNEWTAGKYQPQPGGGITQAPTGLTMPWLGRDNPFIFVDQYNAEFNRCVHPMKDGYMDNYYMQMAQNLRRYKGVRPVPELRGYDRIRIDGVYDDWAGIETEYRDTRGDTYHRDHPGYGGLHYRNNSGRNDLITSKVAVGRQHLYFYAETGEPITDHRGRHWMLLMIDADRDAGTGWYGMDFLINQEVRDAGTTTLLVYEGKDSDGHWEEMAELAFRYEDTAIEIAVPRDLLGLRGGDFVFDFKWSDNPEVLKDPISLCLNGDTAPNRRFNYRCIWHK
jgi:hypothetical protein